MNLHEIRWEIKGHVSSLEQLLNFAIQISSINLHKHTYNTLELPPFFSKVEEKKQNVVAVDTKSPNKVKEALTRQGFFLRIVESSSFKPYCFTENSENGVSGSAVNYV